MANWTETEVDSFNPSIINDTRVRQLEESLPEKRFALTANHSQGPFTAMARVSWFDEFYEPHLDDGSLPIDADDEFIVDAELGYDVNEQITVTAGGQNLFDEKGTKNPWAGVAGAEYSVISPFGFNGGSTTCAAPTTSRGALGYLLGAPPWRAGIAPACPGPPPTSRASSPRNR